jgi:hypothetical protein
MLSARSVGLFAASLSLSSALACLGGISAAKATGTTRIEQANKGVTVYHHTRFTIDNRALSLTSPDGKAELTIALIGCVKAGELHRCQPGGAEYRKNGAVRAIDITSGMLYFNPTGQKQPLSLSSTQVPPHGVILTIHTARGTYLSATAKIDGLK